MEEHVRKSGKHAGKKYTVCVSIYDFLQECRQKMHLEHIIVCPHATIMGKSMEEDFRLQTSKSPTTITFSGYKKPTDRLTLMVVLSLQVAFTSKEISSSLFACGSSC